MSRNFPVRGSHTRSTRSRPPLARNSPLSLSARDSTWSVLKSHALASSLCRFVLHRPGSLHVRAPVSRSHRRMVQSLEPVKPTRPSSLMATVVTESRCA